MRGMRCLVWGLALALISACGTTKPPMDPDFPARGDDSALEPLRIGCSPNYPPIIFTEHGAVTGFEADLARLLASEMNRRPEFVEMDFEALIPALEEHRIDIIISGMSITEARSMRVAFTHPVLRVGQMALVRNEDVRKYDNVGILVGKPVIGVEKGTTGALFVERNCRKAKVKQYASAEKAVQALRRGQVDAVIHDAPLVWWLAARHESDGITFQPQPFTNELIAWCVALDNQELLELTDAVLTRWQESGTLEKYQIRWLPK